MRFRNYFEVNGEKYYTGTVFIAENRGKKAEASFIAYDTMCSRYIYKINDCTYHMPEQYFGNKFIAVTDKKNENVHCPVLKTKKDTDIDGLFLGWLWYIFLMVISIIFKGAIVWWIFISVVFFSWRSKKIKEEGTYYEW